MIDPHIVYVSPADATEACAVLLDDDDAVVLGGGTALLPELGRHERRASKIVDMRGIGLAELRDEVDTFEIGAMTTYAQLLLSPEVADRAPMLVQLAGGITGGAQIRNQGTLGGSACRAVPLSDVPTALTALDAVLRVHGTEGPREIPAGTFFRGPGQTDLASDEILTGISVPHPAPAARFGYTKLKFFDSSWPIVTAGAVLHGAGRATVAVGGLDSRPIRLDLSLPEDGLNPHEFDDLLAASLERPWSDPLADADYRSAVAGTIAARAVAAAMAPTNEKES